MGFRRNEYDNADRKSPIVNDLSGTSSHIRHSGKSGIRKLHNNGFLPQYRSHTITHSACLHTGVEAVPTPGVD
jgi:hypothetical protein